MKKPTKKLDITPNGSFKLDYNTYKYPEDCDVIINEIRKADKVYSKFQKDLGSIYYKNVPASFDIETTNLYVEGEKVAVMYIWMFSVNGKVIIGRLWSEFEDLMRRVEEECNLLDRLIVYVHNLGFDFSFFNRRLQWHKTFCTKVHEPIYAITTGGVEFRDSYILTSKSLASSAKDLHKYKVEKMVGDLDYKLLRGSKTVLTNVEMRYCIHDCLVVDAIIQEKIEEEGSIAKIPLTNTGYVRRFLKSNCFSGSHHKKSKQADEYRRLMGKLTLSGDEYVMLKRAFMGGFTHANALWVGQTITGCVDSFDFTSSYPAVILSELFPMSSAEHYNHVSRETFEDILDNKLSIFNIRFNNIRQKDDVYENYLQVSKCKGSNIVENNCRVVSADYVVTTITNIDFSIIRAFYDFDTIQLGEILAFEKGYLPKPIIESALELYKAKTELKGVEGREVDYQVKKGMFNSLYGCMVTDIVKPQVEYTNNGWAITENSLDEMIEKYNGSKNRFLYYPWGVFVTAYARRNLFYGIKEFGLDYIYSDTDSIKCINADKHIQFINWYNKLITRKVELCLTHYNIEPKAASPKTIKGVEKPIGVWDWETENDKYSTFKTMGAKRYMYIQDNELHITIAGLSKKKGAEYIATKVEPFKFFDDEMYIPSENTGKLLHTYIDKPHKGTFTDCQNNVCEYDELSGVHLEPTFYTLNLTEQFKDYLNNVKESDMMYA